jgi:hypothetical protein
MEEGEGLRREEEKKKEDGMIHYDYKNAFNMNKSFKNMVLA